MNDSVEKYNRNHDAKGRFSTGTGGSAAPGLVTRATSAELAEARKADLFGQHGGSTGSISEDEDLTGAQRRAGMQDVLDQYWNDRAEYEPVYVKALQQYVDESALTIRTSPNTVDAMVRDGRYKNQHETGTSSGMLDPDRRAHLEETLNNVPFDSPAQLKPIYGYMSHGDVLNAYDGPFQYGAVKVVLKDDVRSRTTVTLGDSLSYDRPLPSPANRVDKYSIHPLDVHAGNNRPTPTVDQAVERIDLDANSYGKYVEAQIMGGVSLKDIAHIQVTDAVTPERIALWRAAGLKVGIEGDDGSASVVKFNQNHDARGRFSTGPGSQLTLPGMDEATVPPLPLDNVYQQALVYDEDGTNVKRIGARKVIEGHIRKRLEGQTFGKRLQVGELYFTDEHNTYGFSGDILDENGKWVGHFDRTFTPYEVHHNLLEVNRHHQGTGFGTEFSAASEAMYLEMGIDRITLEAGLSKGGYVWAKAGYEWDGDEGEQALGNITDRIANILSYSEGDDMDIETAAQLNEWVSAMVNFYDTEEYPQPYQIAELVGTDGREWGREIMEGASWNGEKRIFDMTKASSYARMFDNFTRTRKLDLDDAYWSAEDKAAWAALRSIQKFNPNHDAKGRFSTSDGYGATLPGMDGASFPPVPGAGGVAVSRPTSERVMAEARGYRGDGASEADRAAWAAHRAEIEAKYGTVYSWADHDFEGSNAHSQAIAMIDIDDSVTSQARLFGVSEKNLKAGATKALREYVAEGQLAIMMERSTLDRIRREGRFKTAFDDGTEPHGMPHKDIRALAEGVAFGFPKNLPAEVRPVYGYIRPAGDAVRPDVSQYGSTRVILKDTVRPRVTVTTGDSLNFNTPSLATSARNPDHYGFNFPDMEWPAEPEGDSVAQVAEAARYSLDQLKGFDFVEMQVHGGVTVDDIDWAASGFTAPVKKFNQNHDAKGRFSSGPGGSMVTSADAPTRLYGWVPEHIRGPQKGSARHDWADAKIAESMLESDSRYGEVNVEGAGQIAARDMGRMDEITVAEAARQFGPRLEGDVRGFPAYVRYNEFGEFTTESWFNPKLDGEKPNVVHSVEDFNAKVPAIVYSAAVTRLSSSWNSRANYGASLLVADEARVLLGSNKSLTLDEIGINDKYTRIESMNGLTSDAAKDFARSYVNTTYAQTQDYLSANGIASVKVYRGFKVYNGEAPTGAVSLPLRPLSSYSTNRQNALQFSKVWDKTTRGYIHETTVNAEDIFSIGGFGPGAESEGEVIVLAHPNVGTVTETTGDKISLAFAASAHPEVVEFIPQGEENNNWIQTLPLIQKYNPNHDARGRFSSGAGGFTSTWAEWAVTSKESDRAAETVLREAHTAGVLQGLPNADPAARNAVRVYGEDYNGINATLRNPDKAKKRVIDPASYVPALDRAVQGYTTTQPIQVYRGVTTRLGLKPGDVIADKGYLSTSLARSEASFFASEDGTAESSGSILRISVPTGAPTTATGTGEVELLFARDTALRIDRAGTIEHGIEVYDATLMHAVQKYNPNHGADGRFSSGTGGLPVMDLRADASTHEGTPVMGEDGVIRLRTARANFVANTPETFVPLENIYRAVSAEDWKLIQERGYMQTDGRMNLDQSEGTVATNRDPSWYLPTKLGEAGLIVRMDYSPEDNWRVGTDGYLKTPEKIPLSRMTAVSPYTVGTGSTSMSRSDPRFIPSVAGGLTNQMHNEVGTARAQTGTWHAQTDAINALNDFIFSSPAALAVRTKPSAATVTAYAEAVLGELDKIGDFEVTPEIPGRIRETLNDTLKLVGNVRKYNPNHGPDGRFSSGPSGVTGRGLAVNTVGQTPEDQAMVDAAAQSAFRAIASVHNTGNLKKVNVHVRNAADLVREHVPSDVEGWYQPDIPGIINLNAAAVQPVATVVHEFGHALDREEFGDMSFGPQVNVGSGSLSNAPAIRPLVGALVSSGLYHSISTDENLATVLMLNGIAPNDPTVQNIFESRAYLANPPEVFARAYTQWIATKSQQPDLLTAIKDSQLRSPFEQWDDESFAPIAAEFDAYFDGKGLLAKSVHKFNPNHGPDGRFSSGAGGSYPLGGAATRALWPAGGLDQYSSQEESAEAHRAADMEIAKAMPMTPDVVTGAYDVMGVTPDERAGTVESWTEQYGLWRESADWTDMDHTFIALGERGNVMLMNDTSQPPDAIEVNGPEAWRMAEAYDRFTIFQAANKMSVGWNTDSNDYGTSTDLQGILKDVGLTGQDPYADNYEWGIELDDYTGYGAFLGAYAKATYAHTQKILAKRGVKGVVAYRGLDLGKSAQWEFGQVPESPHDIAPNALNSFSTDVTAAKAFAADSQDGGWVLRAEIPAKSIFSIGGYGPGATVENEITVLGPNSWQRPTLYQYGTGATLSESGNMELGKQDEWEEGILKARARKTLGGIGKRDSIEKFNPNHDDRGRFSTSDGAAGLTTDATARPGSRFAPPAGRGKYETASRFEPMINEWDPPADKAFNAAFARQVAEQEFSVIEKVHKLPNQIGILPVSVDRGIIPGANAAYSPGQNTMDLHSSKLAPGDFTHEYGHMLDFRFFTDPVRGQQGWAPGSKLVGSSGMGEVMNLMRESDSMVPVKIAAGNLPSLASTVRAKYLLSEPELFARGYAQWIATKTGDPAMLKTISDRRALPDSAAYTWDAAEFAPISAAYDTLFKSKGLLK